MINPDKTNIYDLFEKIDTHPGIIRFEDEEIHLKKDWLEQVTQSEIENVIEGHLDGTKYVIIPSTRTQNTPKGNLGYVVVKDCKTRLISMIDIRQILMESMFAKPFNELFVKKSMYAGGKNDQQLSRWINDQRLVSNYWYCIDYSSFDQTISNWLIYDAFDIVKSSFTLSPREEQIFDQIVKNFIYKEFIQVDGSHVHSSKGIPSGSRFTQIIGSLCNYLMIKTYFNRMQDCGLKSSVTMGDDNLFFTGREVDIDHLSTYLAHNFGVETNASKFDCGVSHKDAPTFLSRTWNHEGPGRSEVEILSKLMYPEKFRNYVGNVQLDPYLIIFASYLTYPYTWKRSLIKEGSELFYKLRELESKLSLKKLTKEQLVAISGALRYQLEYLDNSWL